MPVKHGLQVTRDQKSFVMWHAVVLLFTMFCCHSFGMRQQAFLSTIENISAVKHFSVHSILFCVQAHYVFV
jgi:hypothetical protein